MGYGDGGGTSPQQRARREQIRRQAARMFAAGESVPKIAAELEGSLKSVYAWRRAWKAGERALASKGPSGPDRVSSEALVAKLVGKLQAARAIGFVRRRRAEGPRGAAGPNGGGVTVAPA